jgi:pimeloyl-ACP methyl ester carboxylesterase
MRFLHSSRNADTAANVLETAVLNIDRRTLLQGGAALPVLSAPCASWARGAGGPIDEQGFVRIGGIDQWIAIQGRDASKPAILYLHGGPAEAQSPFLKEFLPWEQDVTVVNWDQRGSGKTFGKNGPSTSDMTLDRFAQDAIEVAEHVRRRLQKRKIILVGQSWGAALGVHVVKRRPDLFAAFVGTGQVVSWNACVRDLERYARGQATAAGDQAALKALDQAQGLPMNDLRRLNATWRWRFPQSDRDYLKLQEQFIGPPPPPTTGDIADWLAGGDFSRQKLLATVFALDITILGYDFALPMFVIQGRDDHVTSFDAARDWIDRIHAPAKAFTPIDGGHFACFTNPDGFVGALRQHVLPLVRQG